MWWKLTYHRFALATSQREWMALERCLQPPFHLRNVWMIYSMRFIMNLFFFIKFTWCRHCVWHGAKCDCFHSKCCAVLLLLAGWSCFFCFISKSNRSISIGRNVVTNTFVAIHMFMYVHCVLCLKNTCEVFIVVLYFMSIAIPTLSLFLHAPMALTMTNQHQFNCYRPQSQTLLV